MESGLHVKQRHYPIWYDDECVSLFGEHESLVILKMKVTGSKTLLLLYKPGPRLQNSAVL